MFCPLLEEAGTMSRTLAAWTLLCAKRKRARGSTLIDRGWERRWTIGVVTFATRFTAVLQTQLQWDKSEVPIFLFWGLLWTIIDCRFIFFYETCRCPARKIKPALSHIATVQVCALRQCSVENYDSRWLAISPAVNFRGVAEPRFVVGMKTAHRCYFLISNVKSPGSCHAALKLPFIVLRTKDVQQS